jgi:predicted nucleotidyltransferase
MSLSSVSSSGIREDVLRNPRYPVHRIADDLRPYLQTLIEQFNPEQVILFGSYAYGNPTPDSDVDLLVVKPIHSGRVKDKVAIRRAWWPIMRKTSPMSFDLLLATPEEFNDEKWAHGAFHAEIKKHGLNLA